MRLALAACGDDDDGDGGNGGAGGGATTEQGADLNLQTDGQMQHERTAAFLKRVIEAGRAADLAAEV